jgi:hypothetical protein
MSCAFIFFFNRQANSVILVPLEKYTLANEPTKKISRHKLMLKTAHVNFFGSHLSRPKRQQVLMNFPFL